LDGDRNGSGRRREGGEAEEGAEREIGKLAPMAVGGLDIEWASRGEGGQIKRPGNARNGELHGKRRELCMLRAKAGKRNEVMVWEGTWRNRSVEGRG